MKKLKFSLLILMFVMTSETILASENFCHGTGIPGDADQNSEVNINDIVLIVTYILDDEMELSQAGFNCADVVIDGLLNVADIVQLVDLILSCGADVDCIIQLVSQFSCGDEICEEDESEITCPADCDLSEFHGIDFSEMVHVCGDGFCGGNESVITCPVDCYCADTFDVLSYNPSTGESCFSFDGGIYGYLYFSWEGDCYVQTMQFSTWPEPSTDLFSDLGYEISSPFDSQSFYDLTNVPLVVDQMDLLDWITIDFTDGSTGTVENIELQCICGGQGLPEGACDCEGQIFDECGVCGGDGSFCVGCTNSDACNYNVEATIDNGSCLFNDCAGQCGGDTIEDECGVCGGSGADIECWDGLIVCEETNCSIACADTFDVLSYNPSTGESCFSFDGGIYGYLYFSWEGDCYVQTMQFSTWPEPSTDLFSDLGYEISSPFDSQSFYELTNLPLVVDQMGLLDWVTIDFTDGSTGTVENIELQCED